MKNKPHEDPYCTCKACLGWALPARVGDEVVVYDFPHPITGFVDGNPFVGVLTIPNPIVGVIR